MTSKAWFFNHWGELEAGGLPISTTPRSWVLNGYGRCDFAIPLADAMLKEKYIQFGNFVHIKHNPSEDSAGATLPDWTGIIVPSRTWNRDAVVVSAVTAEALLAYRAMPFVKAEGAPDAVFKQILEHAHASTTVQNASLRVHLGRVDTPTVVDLAGSIDHRLTTVTYTDELRGNAYDHIVKMTKAVGMDWDVTGEILPESFALKLTANLYNRKGSEGLVLTPANSDEQSPLLTEQGTITNHIFAYNQANTAETRICQEIVVEASIAKYGVFQTNTVFTGITESEGMLGAAATRQTITRGEPVRIVKRTALNYQDTFSFIAAGNTGFIYDPRVGFNPDGSLGFRSWSRILSADYNDLTDKCVLNVELIARSGQFPDPDGFFV